MAAAGCRGFLANEIPEVWNQATRPEALAHIAVEYNTTADRLERFTVVEVPETAQTRAWVHWIHSQPEAGYVPLMLVHQNDFVAARGFGTLMVTLASLQDKGRPLACLGTCLEPTEDALGRLQGGSSEIKTRYLVLRVRSLKRQKLFER